MIEIDTFRFNSRGEVIAFNNLLRDYSGKSLSVPYLSLIQVYDKSQSISNGSKLFYSYFDISINFTLLYIDLRNAESTWNMKFSPGKIEGGSISDSKEKFFGKMDMYRYRTSYVLRYRALWDKIMGFLILMIAPLEYEDFNKKSRRKRFKKIAKKHLDTYPYLSVIIEIIDGPLKEFDERFRTAEAHGTGSLRTWSFLMHSPNENPAVELLGYWNMLNGTMQRIKDMFDDYSMTHKDLPDTLNTVIENDLY